MDALLCLSPHLDDVALSMGQVLAGRPDAVVVTLFAGTPPRGRHATTFDRNSGFRNAKEAMVMRHREDRAAMSVLQAVPVHLDFLDHQYRAAGDSPDEDAACAVLVELIDEAGITQAVGPLGLAHPDHVIASRVFCRLLHARPALEGWVYEDMPTRVLEPDLIAPALQAIRDQGFAPSLGFLGTGPLDVKERAVDAYASQLWALDRHAYLCPERLHRLVRND